MTTATLNRPKTAVCAQCGETFEHTSTRKVPVTCSAACRRARDAARKAEAKTEPEYPWKLPRALPEKELHALKERSDLFREKRYGRTTGADALVDMTEEWGGFTLPSETALRSATLGDLDQDEPDDTTDPGWVGSPGVMPTVVEPAGVYAAGGHGYVMDDIIDRDRKPLSKLAASLHPTVRAAYSAHRFPITGLYVGQTTNPDVVGRIYVLGRETVDKFDGTNVPPRIARRFCTADALTPLEPFCLTL